MTPLHRAADALSAAVHALPAPGSPEDEMLPALQAFDAAKGAFDETLLEYLAAVRKEMRK